MISDLISNASIYISQTLADRPEVYAPFASDIDRLLQHMEEVREKLDSVPPIEKTEQR